MRQLPPLVDKRVLQPAQTARALQLVSDMDLLRLKAIARIYARGLPSEITWEDLLQESEIASLSDATPGPEQRLSARQELKAINSLFSKDAAALKIIDGLGKDLSAEQIQRSTGLSKTHYDSTRRRMRRLLIREGLVCETK